MVDYEAEAEQHLDRATDSHAKGDWTSAITAYEDAMRSYALAGKPQHAHTVGRALVLAENRIHLPKQTGV